MRMFGFELYISTFRTNQKESRTNIVDKSRGTIINYGLVWMLSDSLQSMCVGVDWGEI